MAGPALLMAFVIEHSSSGPGRLMLYNRAVRRLLASAIAFLIVLPAISPLFALIHSIDPTRPACCRRDGKHRCMLAEMDSSASSYTSQGALRWTRAAVSQRCPYGSRVLPGTAHRDWSLRVSEAIFAGVASHPAMAPQTESKRRISADRSRQKRGPPGPVSA